MSPDVCIFDFHVHFPRVVCGTLTYMSYKFVITERGVHSLLVPLPKKKRVSRISQGCCIAVPKLEDPTKLRNEPTHRIPRSLRAVISSDTLSCNTHPG